MSFDEKPGQYKVRDLSLAEAGRHQIRLAEHEMPGLMALHEEFGPDQPLVQQGPWAAIGLGLLGVAICQHFNSPETEA